MSDNVTITLLADSINHVATAINSFGGIVGALGFMFLVFKKMSGHEKITVKKDNE